MLYSADRIHFIALIDLDREGDNCLGVITTRFHGIKTQYLAYDSESVRHLPGMILEAIDPLTRKTSAHANIVVVFEARLTMFEDSGAANSISERFSSLANRASIYTPAVDLSTGGSAQRENVLDCSGLVTFNFVGSANVIKDYFNELDSVGSVGLRAVGDCTIQFDYENMFFRTSTARGTHLQIAPLVTFLDGKASGELTTFFKRRYPRDFQDVASKFISSRLFSSSSYFTTNFNCESEISLLTSTSSHTQIQFPLYWINLPTSHDRKERMENHLMKLTRNGSKVQHFRVQAKDEKASLAYLRGVHLPLWLSLKTGLVTYQDHVEGKYSLHEFACLLSHITAIRRAYDNGDTTALILEDDALLRDDFFSRIHDELSAAPVDWEILQLYTINPLVVRQLRKVRQSSFVDWYPDHWSTAAYLISREGMGKVISAFSTLTGETKSQGDQENLARVLVADEFLFLHAKTYTATFSFVQAEPSDSTIHESGISIREVNELYSSASRSQCQIEARSPCPVSLLLATDARVTDVRQAQSRVLRTIANMNSLKYCVLHVEASLTFVVHSEQLAKEIRHSVVSSHSDRHGLRLTVEIWASRYNKFWYVRNLLPYMSSFDKVMIIDSDILLTGFPVSDFFESTQGSVISSAPRRGVEDSLLSNSQQPVRQWFGALSGGDWVPRMDPGLDSRSKRLKVTFLEMYFAVLDGSFAHWFFGQILSEQFLHEEKNIYTQRLESDFGPDILWCGAADSWIKLTQGAQEPCVLSLFTLLHLDERSIPNQSMDKPGQGAKKVHIKEEMPLHTYHDTFTAWFEFSSAFRAFLGGKKVFDKIFLTAMSARMRALPTRCIVT